MKLLKYKDESMEYTYYLKKYRRIRHGLYQDRYWNGGLKCEYNYKDDKTHGPSKDWDRSGKLIAECYCWEGVKYESQEAYEESFILNKAW